MDDCNIFEALGQVSSGEAGSIFRNFLRGSVRHLISQVMADEVVALCAPNIVQQRAITSEAERALVVY